MTKLDRCYNISDLRSAARRRLPRGIFEYLDRGSEDEVALAENLQVFRRLRLRTRVLRDLTARRLDTTLFGKPMSLPLAIAPTGIAGLCWYEGELALAKAAAEAGVPFTLATGSVTSMEKIAGEARGRLWFQLYMWNETGLSFELVDRARDAGFEALIVTVDSALGSNREYNRRNGFNLPFVPSTRAIVDMLCHPSWLSSVLFRYLLTTGMPRHENYPKKYQHRITTGIGEGKPMRHLSMTWDDISRLRDHWTGPMIVKGILSAEDAVEAVKHGADGVVISNHGGRAMDSAISPLEILPEIVAACGEKTTILLDGGVRRGSDVVKAIALGAKAVLVGRATIYGMAVAGQAGAEHALKIIRSEFEKTMAYTGCRTVPEISSAIFASTRLRG